MHPKTKMPLNLKNLKNFTSSINKEWGRIIWEILLRYQIEFTKNGKKLPFWVTSTSEGSRFWLWQHGSGNTYSLAYYRFLQRFFLSEKFCK